MKFLGLFTPKRLLLKTLGLWRIQLHFACSESSRHVIHDVCINWL